jgi:small conductance mechanosensitive channel
LYLLLTYAVYRILSLFLSRQKRLSPHSENLARLILRVAAITIALIAVFSVYELPTSWFLGSSALVGAFLGFGSSQTINNVAAGFYVIISKPFEVKDYIKLGDVEGQVEEISINYTKLYTPTFNLLEIPNVQVLNSRVLNCTHEGFIKNTFVFTVPHATPLRNDDLYSKVFKPAIDEKNAPSYHLQLPVPS